MTSHRHGALRQRLLLPGLLAAGLLLGGCLGEAAVDRASIRDAERLEIAVDGEGWLVSAPDNEGQRVREAVEVTTSGGDLLVVWHNRDGRSHEIMFGPGHHGPAYVLAPGERLEKELESGFEGSFHSHGAHELSELQLTIHEGGR